MRPAIGVPAPSGVEGLLMDRKSSRLIMGIVLAVLVIGVIVWFVVSPH